ncbi:hypothetical protein [Fusobacterium nucleatum]|uniref:Pilus assembly protein PilO n=1 Tax=Fusobacterium nucleatum TaxID=851 RepID=A0AAX3MAT8_FUSNU|nr:hypothetical protein [Fusobacterium nucleatum]MDH2316008.1 hypothetical protein [Fusobacterium nucleatum]WDA44073.1 hypothetical protein PSR69_00195 [Fusobacterium nucleatum]
MDKDFNFNFKNKNLKIIVLIFIYLLAFYFLIFKNIFKLNEIKELVEQEDIKIGKLNYEKNVVLKALDIKRKDFEKDSEKIEKQGEKSDKDEFDNIPSLFNYIEEKISKNNIIFQSFGRSRKDGDKLKVTMVLNGSEGNIKNFFREIENENYDINFSSSYLKISVDKNLLEVKTTLSASVLNKTEKIDSLIDNNTNNKDIFKRSNKNSEGEDTPYSYMRIGNKTYYRVSKKKVIENKNTTENEEEKKNKKSEDKKSNKKEEDIESTDNKKEKVEET